MDFFNDTTLIDYNNTTIGENIYDLQNSSIVVSNKKDVYGYETPYSFHIKLITDNAEYNLPVINYGISKNTCYIYSVQNKVLNEENDINKKIKRNLNKVNKDVNVIANYDKKDTILGTTPSFIIATIIFLQILKQNNIDDIRVVTFLPDRYFEKLGTDEYDADTIQHNLTEKLILLFYRIQYHIKEIDIEFPMYEGNAINKNDYTGDDLVIKLPKKIECENNDLIKEIINAINENNKGRNK